MRRPVVHRLAPCVLHGALALLFVPPAVGGALDLARQGQSDDAVLRMRAAMLSVHALVDRERPGWHPILGGVVPVAPDRIADILKMDDGPVGRARQRRAGLRLLALAANRHADDRIRAEARAAARRLRTPAEVDYILGVIDRLAPDRDCQQPIEDVEPIVAALAEPTCIGTCCWTGPEPRMYEDGKTFDVNMDLDFTGQTLAKAAQGVDPQEWDQCSALWKHTWLCKLKPDGTPEETNGRCVEQAVVPAGSDFGGKRLLYEHFECDGIPCSAELYLDARVTHPTPTNAYDLWYTDPRPIAGPEIRPDQGNLAMSVAGNVLTARSRKTFGFADYGDEAVVALILRNIELSHYLGELVCCKP